MVLCGHTHRTSSSRVWSTLPPPGVSLKSLIFVRNPGVNPAVAMSGERDEGRRGTGSAHRRRERRPRSMLRHERMAVSMAVAEATRHSSRGPKDCHSRQGGGGARGERRATADTPLRSPGCRGVTAAGGTSQGKACRRSPRRLWRARQAKVLSAPVPRCPRPSRTRSSHRKIWTSSDCPSLLATS